MAHKGKFTPKNPAKYRGDPTNIIYRSSWELTCMRKFDLNSNVLEWSSEEVRIPYNTVLDELDRRNGKRRRVRTYYVDFYVKIRDREGNIKKYLIEVKPSKQVKKPNRADYSSRSQKRYEKDMRLWIVNDAKWRAAAEYAADRGMKFEIYTEKTIYG